MPFHLLAYTKLDTAGATNEDIPGVTDNFASLQNNHYILQNDTNLMAAYARNAGLTNARINTPHFRAVSIPSVRPVNVTAAVPTLPPYEWLYPSRLLVPRIDEVAFEASNGGGGGVRTVGGIWVSSIDHTLNIPPGNRYKLRFTVTIAATAFVWTAGAFTLDQSLPAGNYTVIGMDVFGVTTEFARLSFLGGGMRPGVLTQLTVGAYDNRLTFQDGNAGVYGTFANTAQPNLEVFATATASIAYTGWLDVVKTG